MMDFDNIRNILNDMVAYGALDMDIDFFDLEDIEIIDYMHLIDPYELEEEF